MCRAPKRKRLVPHPQPGPPDACMGTGRLVQRVAELPRFGARPSTILRMVLLPSVGEEPESLALDAGAGSGKLRGTAQRVRVGKGFSVTEWQMSALVMAIGYLLGSIPFGLVLTALTGGGDLRKIGSGNIGATNVLRTGRKGLAAATVILDGAKGAVAVYIGERLLPGQGAVLGGVMAFIGHCYPIWLKFKGGKGVATMLFVALAFDWRIGLIAAAVWLGAFCLSRISSVGGISAAISAPIAALALGAMTFSNRWRRSRPSSCGSTGPTSSACSRARNRAWAGPHRKSPARDERCGGRPSRQAAPCPHRAMSGPWPIASSSRASAVPARRWTRFPIWRPGAVAQAFRIADARATAAEIDKVERLGARHVFLGDADYPPLLTEADGSPAALIARGTVALGAERSVAIVGARNASAAACRFARELAHGLAAQGVVIVSGLARGIDTAAHTGATSARTVAVIGCGIDVVFPPENARLQESIANEGLLLTELPPGAEPLARHFPARNRIIAWMSVGTVVVEAAPRSGSLLTARLAGKEGRDVMAVPGFPADPRAQGCNGLIREGAILVQSVEDVIEAISSIDPRAMREPRAGYEASPTGDLRGYRPPTRRRPHRA